MTYFTPERMAEGRRSIAKAKDAVRYAMQDLEAVVQGHFEPGDKVEYQHGLGWVGPCTLIAVYGLNEFADEAAKKQRAEARYQVVEESVSAHCCFEATVVDTSDEGSRMRRDSYPNVEEKTNG